MGSKVFIGSTEENKSALDALIELLGSRDIETIRGELDPGRMILNELIKIARQVHFAIFILSPDDSIEMRKQLFVTPRDNLIFEAGLFMSSLGSERVILLVPSSVDPLRLPSDFAGLTYVKYDTGGNPLQKLDTVKLRQSLNAPASAIAMVVRKLGPRQPPFAPAQNVPIYPKPRFVA
jgi:predicted nucleotide-binding protein